MNIGRAFGNLAQSAVTMYSSLRTGISNLVGTPSSSGGRVEDGRAEAMKHVANTVAASTVIGTMWPPTTHDDLLRRAFPFLSRADYDPMRFGSREMDAAGGLIPVTLLEQEAYKHAMTPGAKVREFEAKGLSHDDAVNKAQEWAREEAKKFVDGKGEEAKQLMQQSERATNKSAKESFRRQAMFAFGEGAHTLMDNTSPAHRDFQIYDTEPYAKEGTLRGGFDFMLDMREHKGRESDEPTPSERRATNQALQNYFGNIFGEAALRQAVTGELPTPPKPANVLPAPVPAPHPTPTPRPGR